MFKIPIWDKEDRKVIRVVSGMRYRVFTDDRILGGVIIECVNSSFIIETRRGDFIIDFESIDLKLVNNFVYIKL